MKFLLPIFGILLYFAVRLHNILALPLFIDESLSGVRSLDMLAGSPLWFAEHGKVLLPWWGALFLPDGAVPFLIRVSALLLAVLSAAVAFSLAKRIYGLWTGYLALILVIFNPMLFFFDRLALSDTALHAMISLFIFCLYVLFARNTFKARYAVLVSIALILCMLAKATALSILPLPIVGILLLTKWDWKTRLKSLAWIYGTTLTLWFPFQLMLILRGINYLSTAGVRSGGGSKSLIQTALSNTQFLLDGLSVYFTASLLVVFALLMIVSLQHRGKINRDSLFLAAGIFGPGLALVLFGGAITMRYWLLMLPVAMVLAAGGLITLTETQKNLRIIMSGLLVIWLLWIALPLMQTAYTNPAELRLPQSDLNEYITYDSSGFGIPEAVDYLESTNADLVIGAIANCDTLFFYAPSFRADCPNVLSGGRRGEWLDNYIVERAQTNGAVYVVFESPGYASAEEMQLTEFELLYEIPRPYGGNILQIYRVQLK